VGSDRQRRDQRILVARLIVFAVALVPVAALLIGAFTGELSANPIEEVIHESGEWGLRLLLVALAITPLRWLTGWPVLVRFRRMLGLFAFFYVCMHLTAYVVLENFFDWAAIFEDIVERPYITIGMVAFVVLLPLAITSTNKMMKRLGGARWRRLHRLAYLAPALGCLHFLLLVKADTTEPLVYAGILSVLLLTRMAHHFYSKRRRHSGRSAMNHAIG
jgi:sulfoxide reductase heme-binding subunit YedZ